MNVGKSELKLVVVAAALLTLALAPLNIYVSPYLNAVLIFPLIMAFVYARGKGVFSLKDALLKGLLALSVFLLIFAAFFTFAVYQKAGQEAYFKGIHVQEAPSGFSPDGSYSVRVWSDSGQLQHIVLRLLTFNETEVYHQEADGDNVTFNVAGLGEGLYFIRASATYANGTYVLVPDKLGPLNMRKPKFYGFTALSMVPNVFIFGLLFYMAFAYGIRMVRRGKVQLRQRYEG